ncbi:class I SAM-dependent methyltransferase [Methanotorris formicicus]|uniref:Methyltransferase n=1 Tax=Methanotorris formicicus Mc-S-70 TaxID=647171 RepID=H1KX90_9EURY|nr:class I SAM-dependent methyltransferase [Methanotorris formicicus]EHP88521.1 methyltransferase [Methanotorris formicicus Mc-S-70]
MVLERMDALKESENLVEKEMHISRYKYAANIINSHIYHNNYKKSLSNSKYKVLDIACGLGYGSYLLNKLTGASVVGVDIDKKR